MSDLYEWAITYITIFCVIQLAIAILIGTLFFWNGVYKLTVKEPVPIFTNEQAIEAMDCLAREQGE